MPPPKTERLSKTPSFLLPENELWADSVLKTLTKREKIQELIFWEQNDLSPYLDIVPQLGGVLLQTPDPRARAVLTNQYIQESKVGVIIGAEGAFGLSLPAHPDYAPPNESNLLNLRNDSVRNVLSEYVAMQLHSMQVNLNFAPSIAHLMRQSGMQYDLQDEKLQTDMTSTAYRYHRTLAEHKIIACITGFPNIRFASEERNISENIKPLWQTENHKPIIQLIDSGIQAMGVMHYPYYLQGIEYDNQLLHKPTVDNSLRKTTAFQGLIISDIRDKENSRIYAYKPLCLDALVNGSDMLLIRDSLTEVIDFLEKELYNKLDKKRIDEKVKRVLMLKSWTGAKDRHLIQIEELLNAYQPATDQLMAENIYGESMVLLRDYDNLVPLNQINKYKPYVLYAEGALPSSFIQTLNDHFKVSPIAVAPFESEAYYQTKEKQIKDGTIILLADENLWNKDDSRFNTFINNLNKARLIVVWMGGHRALNYMGNVPTLLLSYGKNKTAQRVAANILLGAMPVYGNLPFTCSDNFCYADGEKRAISRLKFTIPEEVGILSEWLRPIDSIAMSGVNRHAMPGCQVFISIKGKVIFRKSYGFHTYSKEFPVQNNNLYDIASVTKVAATTLAVMRLYDEEKLSLDSTVSTYLNETNGTALGNTRIRDILLHKAGFPAAPPVFQFIRAMQRFRISGKKETVDNKHDTLYRFAFDDTESKDYPLSIAESLYLHKDMPDSIWKTVIPTKLNRPTEYKYSDMGMYVMMYIIESITKHSLEEYVNATFYAPLQLERIGYNSFRHFEKEEIIPTENEKIFRRQLIHGYVHDPVAALLGGVSGHAGLFSNATDLGVLMQMVLNGGSYAEIRYFSPATAKFFTSIQPGSHRGLGWDHQFPSRSPNIADSASVETYGHLGFTGTCVWVDPKYEMIFVFLSNRIYPNADNKKLMRYRIRQNIQQVVYRALWLGEKKERANHKILEGGEVSIKQSVN